MELFKRALRVLAVFMLTNLGLLEMLCPLPGAVHWPLLLGLLGVYMWFHICPRRAKGVAPRLRAMIGGYELLLASFLVLVAEVLFYAALLFAGLPLVPAPYSAPRWVAPCGKSAIFPPAGGRAADKRLFPRGPHLAPSSGNMARAAVVFVVGAFFQHLSVFPCAENGAQRIFLRMCTAGGQRPSMPKMRIAKRVTPSCWCMVSFSGTGSCLATGGEFRRPCAAAARSFITAGSSLALPVAQSGEELARRLREVLRETGAEKVNIIAHSKGGLDSRWAITRLGLAPQVASLTTVNTPHRGCVFAQHLLGTMPKGLVAWIARRYNTLFHTLGDTSPDFLGGVKDLTRQSCLAFNEAVPDAPGVLYQSVTSAMRGASSAGFPLNITWHFVTKYDKEANDGLVACTSAEWGRFLGCLTAPGRRGISHGDMIDLMREDVPGFDVREFYMELVKGLKARGL